MLLRNLSLVGCILMCMPGPAKAHQVQLGVAQGVEVESNVLASPVLPTTDARYRLSPTVTLSQPESAFTYNVHYRPVYSGYFRTDGINGWDHLLYGRSSYELSGRDTIRVRANYFQVRGVRGNTVADANGDPLVIATQPGTTSGFDSKLFVDHSFSQRTFGTVGFGYNRWDFSNPTRIGNQGLGAELQLNHALDPRWTVGLGVDTRYRSFEETQGSPASYSTVVNSNLLVRLNLTERTSLDLSGGPAGVFSRQGTPGPQWVSRWDAIASDPVVCPVGPCGRVWGPTASSPPACGTSLGVPVLNSCLITGFPVTGVPGFPDEQVLVPLDPNQNVFGLSTESLTYFGSIALSQRFRNGALRLSFVRNEDAGSGSGGSTIINSGNASFVYKLSDLWRLNVHGTYFVRETLSQFPVTNVSAQPSSATAGGVVLAEAGLLIAGRAVRNFRQEVGSAEASLTRQLGEHSSLRFRFRYYDQAQLTAGGATLTRFDNFTGGVYYVYEFDPFKL